MTIPEQIAAIISRYDDHWRSDEALKEAVAAWGAEGHVNDHGVFVNYQKETVAKHGNSVAEVGIYKVRDGVFVHCTRLTVGTSSTSYAPCVWRSVPHATEKEARQAGIMEMLERLGKEAGSNAAREEMRQIKRQLQGLIQQPTLF